MPNKWEGQSERGERGRRFWLNLLNGGGEGVQIKWGGGLEFQKNPLISVMNEKRNINF